MIKKSLNDLRVKYDSLYHNISFDCRDGWYDIIDNLSSYILCHLQNHPHEHCDPRHFVEQIKEKFGVLRYYVGPACDCILNMIEIAEEQSAKTCEQCGNRGELYNMNHWYYTRCRECAVELWGKADE